jgi:hypothetical protein
MTDKEMVKYIMQEAIGYLYADLHYSRSLVAEAKTKFCKALDEARDHLEKK